MPALLAPPASDLPAAPASWWKSIAIYLAIVVPTGLLCGFAIYIPLLLALGLIIVAVPYVAFVTVVLLKRRRVASVQAQSKDVEIDVRAAAFRTRSQQLSLINAGALGIVALIGLASANLGVVGEVTYVALVLLALLSALEIGVNAPWIYSNHTAFAEAHAIRHRAPARTIIRVNRTLSWIIWYVGAIAAVVSIVAYIVTMTSMENASVY
jgi:hypothetical protein